jgi:hypothetical protein
VTGACLAGWWCHHRGFPMVEWLTGDFPPNHFHAQKHVGFNVKCPLLLSNFNPNWNVFTNFKLPNAKFYENQFSSSQILMCTCTWIETQINDRQGKSNKCISATIICKCASKGRRNSQLDWVFPECKANVLSLSQTCLVTKREISVYYTIILKKRKYIPCVSTQFLVVWLQTFYNTWDSKFIIPLCTV